MVLKDREEKLTLKIQSRSKKEAFRKLLRVGGDLIDRVDYAYEVAICKDILADGWDIEVAVEAIEESGYTEDEATVIVGAVIELTEYYTKENFPNQNRRERKELEVLRLHKIGFLASCVWMSDNYYKLFSIVDKESKFKRILANEIWDVLKGMVNVEDYLYLRLCTIIFKVKTNDQAQHNS